MTENNTLKNMSVKLKAFLLYDLIISKCPHATHRPYHRYLPLDTTFQAMATCRDIADHFSILNA